jgi:hypothetical protein
LDPQTIALILDAVCTYDEFDEGIEPYGEHDIGRLTIDGKDYYWKIDYYDRNLEFPSPDPADPSVTVRVLAIMRVEHYSTKSSSAIVDLPTHKISQAHQA